MALRVEAVSWLALALVLVLAGILLAARPASRTSRMLTQALGAIAVAAVVLSIVAVSPARTAPFQS